MIDNTQIITKWNNLFNWRKADTSLSNITLSKNPCLYIFSAQTHGFKGYIPRAKHLYISIYDGKKFKTIEVTDIESVKKLEGNILSADYEDITISQVLISDRDPRLKWFGNKPKIEFVGKYIHIESINYPFNKDINLRSNNCNRFVSYLCFLYDIDYDCDYIGFKTKTYWKKTLGF